MNRKRHPTAKPDNYGVFYRSTLLRDIVPFWETHGYDREHGGIGNILDDDGTLLGHDKYLWSQGRALWTFSALYNHLEPRPQWLQFADHIFNYLRTLGRDKRGYWMYRLDKDGNTLDRDISIYVDGFVMNGMAEYYLATKNRDAHRISLEAYDTIAMRLSNPGSYGTAPYDIPSGMKAHGVAMIFSFFFYNLGEALQRFDIREHGIKLAHEILNDFYVPERNAILEFVNLDGSFSDTPEGRTCVPGHAIEALWFLISIFERSGQEKHISECCRLIKRHLELAWDNEQGGLTLGLDIDGKTPIYWQKHDYKPWWVQVEALVATAYAHLHTQETWCMEWHERVREFAFAYYPVATGEWTQWLSNTGEKMGSAALPVKDPFHLPRALIYLVDLFENRMTR